MFTYDYLDPDNPEDVSLINHVKPHTQTYHSMPRKLVCGYLAQHISMKNIHQSIGHWRADAYLIWILKLISW